MNKELSDLLLRELRERTISRSEMILMAAISLKKDMPQHASAIDELVNKMMGYEKELKAN